MVSLGVITIGQTPRADLTPELQSWLPRVHLIERGALDRMSDSEIAGIAPTEGQETLVSRAVDGSQVIVAAEHVHARLQLAIHSLKDEVDAILLACTGDMPSFEASVPVIQPDRVLSHALAGIAGSASRIGIICPIVAQAGDVLEKFRLVVPSADLITEAISPYTASEEEFKEAGNRLKTQGVEIIVLDCMGYTESMRSLIAESSHVPVLLARSTAARMSAEILDSITSYNTDGEKK